MKKYSIENQLVLARKFIEEDLERGVGYYSFVFHNNPNLMTEDDFIDLALAYEDLNEIEKGIDVYKNLINSFPQSDRGYYGLGVLSEELNKPEDSIVNYLKAIELNPDFFEAYFYLAGVYDDEEDTENAIRNYEMALKLDSDHYYANLNLGSIYEGLNENEKAYEFFMKALNIDYHFMALFNLGVLANKASKHEKAIEYYEDCLRLNPDYGYGYLNLSLIYKEKNDLIKAQEILSLGIEVTQNVSYLYYHRGCNYALLNEKDKSIDDLKIALELYPEFDRYMETDTDLDSVREDIDNLIQFPYL